MEKESLPSQQVSPYLVNDKPNKILTERRSGAKLVKSKNSSWNRLVEVMKCTLRIYLVIATAILLLIIQITSTSGQKFYVNGRYGRRSEPSSKLTDMTSGREMLISFFGDNGVTCVYTGLSNLYKCSRTDSDVDSADDR
ncbi:Uncharacterised protein g627 [Pycnogonum litorale]